MKKGIGTVLLICVILILMPCQVFAIDRSTTDDFLVGTFSNGIPYSQRLKTQLTITYTDIYDYPMNYKEVTERDFGCLAYYGAVRYSYCGITLASLKLYQNGVLTSTLGPSDFSNYLVILPYEFWQHRYKYQNNLSYSMIPFQAGSTIVYKGTVTYYFGHDGDVIPSSCTRNVQVAFYY